MDYPRYDPRSPLTPLTPAEIDGLDRLLQALPADGVMTLDGVDGYLTALQVGPPELLAHWPTADWLPLVWGGDGPLGNEEATPFASKRQRKATVVELLRHLRHIGEVMSGLTADGGGGGGGDDWEPIFSIAEQGARDWADASDWCAGFLQAVDLLPDAWAVDWAHPALAPLLTLGGGLSGGLDGAPQPTPADDAETIDALSRAVPDAVLHLRSRAPAASSS